MSRFEKLIDSNPRAALKKLKEFEDSLVWEYFLDKLELSRELQIARLLNCDVDEIFEVRGKIKYITYVKEIPEKIRGLLDDSFEMIKAEKKLEKGSK